jgi:hypothetical protein
MEDIITVKSNAVTQSRTSNKVYNLISTNTKKYYVWDAEMAKKLEIGKSYRVDIQDGKYPVIKQVISEANPDDKLECNTVSPNRAFTSNDQDRHKDLMAIEQLKVSSEIFHELFFRYNPEPDKMDEDVKKLMDLAIYLTKTAYNNFLI